MTKQKLIDRTVNILSRLPKEKIIEVSDFAAFILKKAEEEELQQGINSLVADGAAFDFLKEDEELYSTDDLKEKF